MIRDRPSHITDFEWQSSNFYGQPKIHKSVTIINKVKETNELYPEMEVPNDLTARPIVAGTTSPTQRLSELLEKLLTPLVCHLKSFIKDDWDFIKKLPHQLDPNSHIYSCDIVSLYTSITHELGIKALEYWITKRRNLIPSRFTNQFILEAVSFVLENNNFLFDHHMYHQLIGTAMGTKLAPPYACLAIGFLEETKLYPELSNYFSEEQSELIINQFLRFMDDGFTAWPNTLNIDIFKTMLNNMDEHIQFTIEAAKETTDIDGISYQYLNFLDIKVILLPSGQINTDIYYKPTNTHDYLPFTSQHPKNTKENIPYNLAKRIIAFTTNSEKEKKNLISLKNWLLQCGYPKPLIKKKFHKAKLQGPAPKPKNKNIIPVVTTFCSNYDLSEIVNRSKSLLFNTRDDTIKEIFDNSQIVLSLKQPPNLLRHLTTAKFNHNKDVTNHGISKCTHPLCKICDLYIKECKSFITSNNTEWFIKGNINCKSKNVIYYLKCIACQFKVTYTGKTNELRPRMNNHITACRHGTSTDTFDNHVFKCRIEHNIHEEPFFEIMVFMELPEERLLLTYESYLHSKGFDTLN